MADATMKDVMQYFGMTTAEFSKEWRALDAQSKADLKAALSGDVPSLTY